ncbi:hypothetical protein, conserved [Plasmodium vivax]|uniref:Uncharacterized protein n=1 Tax=Plasmodium vivax (strain Salvador I) TaxID=126793 RepID=A5K0T8_PLAVS|nr:hypothetical protein, conserved [Plasmodium vivax]EDL46935.1 hypothetical protein, conserved [Plasmodium vivax]|eukprot:XP_001616662.1 hypothetical protein [Plasmodium vivax Sal-1]
MGYAHNNKRRNKKVSGSDVGHYLKGKGPRKSCKESKPVELCGQNVPHGGGFHAHSDALLGGQGMRHFYRRADRMTNGMANGMANGMTNGMTCRMPNGIPCRMPNNTYSYCREDGARGKAGEATYVFYEPLRYPAFKMADRRSGGGGENGDEEKDAAKRNKREASEEGKVVPPPAGDQNGESYGGAEEVSIATAHLTHIGKTKKQRSRDNLGVKKQSSKDNQEVKNNRERGDDTAQVKNLPGGGPPRKEAMQRVDGQMKDHSNANSSVETQMSSASSSMEGISSPVRGKRERGNFFIPITAPTVLRHPKEVTNEVKFILHMTILTLYKDQIKPTYKKIKHRLGTFHQNAELENNFLEICLSLQNEYLVVKSKRNNLFVLLRETPKWFSGWIKTRSFVNPYPEVMWRKFARHLLHACRAGATGESPPGGLLAIQFAKHLFRKGHLFSLSSDALEGALGWFGEGSSTPHGEPAGNPRGLFTFNLLHDSFSYFSRVNDAVVRLVEGSLVGLHQSILAHNGRSGEMASNEGRSGAAASSGEGSGDPPVAWELDSDIYQVADRLKKRGVPFLSDYSVGKIAHIVQLGLYGGLLHEEGQAIKPACCCRGVAASVWGGGKMGGQVSRQVSSQVSGEVSGEVGDPPGSGLTTEEPPHQVNFRCVERQGPPRGEIDGGETEEAPVTRIFGRHMEGADANMLCSDASLPCCDASLRWRDTQWWPQTGGGGSQEGRCEGVPLVPTAEDAKVKIDQLLKGSNERIIFFCSFKDKFFKKFEEVLSPLQFGCRSLIEFLFFHCQEVCKLFLLNRNVILVPPSCDEQSVKDIVREEQADDDDDDGGEHIIEQFDYEDYVSRVAYDQKSGQTQQGGLQIRTVLKDLGRRRDTFFITFSFWKCVAGRGKAPPR